MTFGGEIDTGEVLYDVGGDGPHDGADTKTDDTLTCLLYTSPSPRDS